MGFNGIPKILRKWASYSKCRMNIENAFNYYTEICDGKICHNEHHNMFTIVKTWHNYERVRFRPLNISISITDHQLATPDWEDARAFSDQEEVRPCAGRQVASSKSATTPILCFAKPIRLEKEAMAKADVRILMVEWFQWSSWDDQ